MQKNFFEIVHAFIISLTQFDPIVPFSLALETKSAAALVSCHQEDPLVGFFTALLLFSCGYMLDVFWGQRIKLIQVVSTSEFHEY